MTGDDLLPFWELPVEVWEWFEEIEREHQRRNMKKFSESFMRTETIARICHEVNRIYCQSVGDKSQKPWDEAEQWQRDSAVMGVVFAITNPNATPADQHEAWLKDKLKDGWQYGPVKDAAKKEHPCIVPYEELGVIQQYKDKLFQTIVKAATSENHKAEQAGSASETKEATRPPNCL